VNRKVIVSEESISLEESTARVKDVPLKEKQCNQIIPARHVNLMKD